MIPTKNHLRDAWSRTSEGVAWQRHNDVIELQSSWEATSHNQKNYERIVFFPFIMIYFVLMKLRLWVRKHTWSSYHYFPQRLFAIRLYLWTSEGWKWYSSACVSWCLYLGCLQIWKSNLMVDRSTLLPGVRQTAEKDMFIAHTTRRKRCELSDSFQLRC